MANPEVAQRLEKLFPAGRGLFLAYDQGFEHGPTDFSGENADPAYILKLANSGCFNGFICHRGIAEEYAAERTAPLILKLNGKTSLPEGDPVSKAVATVADALELGAEAVGYTVYVGSQHESEMLTEFGQILDEAHAAGLPVFAWMYPRGESVKDPHDPEAIAYAARVGLEMGADVLKLYYPGDEQHVEQLVKLAGRSKVVIAGGTKESPAEFAIQIKSVLAAGAAGLAVGRNVWQADDPEAVARELKAAVEAA
jgi:class I fructose-bisphosphate aldolase